MAAQGGACITTVWTVTSSLGSRDSSKSEERPRSSTDRGQCPRPLLLIE